MEKIRGRKLTAETPAQGAAASRTSAALLVACRASRVYVGWLRRSQRRPPLPLGGGHRVAGPEQGSYGSDVERVVVLAWPNLSADVSALI